MLAGQDTVNEEDYLGFESSQEVSTLPIKVNSDEKKVLKQLEIDKLKEEIVQEITIREANTPPPKSGGSSTSRKSAPKQFTIQDL